MAKIDAMLIGAKIKAASAKERLVERVKSVEFGDSQLVVALVLIAIAVGLCVVFRNTINDLMGDLMGKLKTTIENLTKGEVTTNATYPKNQVKD